MTVAHRAAVAAVLSVLLTAPAAFAAPGDLDPTFGGDGVVQAQAGSRSSELNALALSGDRVLAAGTEFAESECHDAALVRWLADGTPDPSFGVAGVAVTPTFSCNRDFGHVVRPLALLAGADGSAITGGDAGGQAIGNDGEIVTAHTPSGALDPAFGGGDGFVHDGDYFHGHINDLVRLPDGRIGAVGLDYGIRNGWGLSRYEPDGDADASFGGGDGYVVHRPFGNQSLQAALADGDDGSLLVAGSAWDRVLPSNPTVARTTADGSLDGSFGAAGVVRVPIEGELTDMARTPDGGFVTSGRGPGGFLLLKFDAAGALDETFGAMGRVDGPADGTAWAVGVDAAERIVVAGGTADGRFTVARYLANGAPDDTFGAGGVRTLPLETEPFGIGANSLAVQPDGRIVVGGTALLDGRPAFTVVRLLAEGGELPATGGDEGTASSDGQVGTAPGSGPIGAGPVPNRQATGGRVTIRILSRRVTRRGVLVRVTWPRGTAGSATARLRTRSTGLLLGRRTVTVLKGTTGRRFRIPLNRRAKRMLRGGRVLKVRASVRVVGLPARR